jgi:predicted RNase H-like HicB family nuclease
MHYVGVLDGGGTLWGVRVPDLPGCVGAGSTPEQALADAAKALRDVIAHKRGGGFAFPRARSLDEILASGEMEGGEAAVLIPLLLDSGRTVRANVTFDAGLLEAIDAAAEQRGLSVRPGSS